MGWGSVCPRIARPSGFLFHRDLCTSFHILASLLTFVLELQEFLRGKQILFPFTTFYQLSEWFPVNVELRQCCVMSPWLFNVYIDGVVREVNVRVLGKWLELLSANGGRFEIHQLLLADDTALVADSEEKLGRLVSEFGRVCKES